MPEKSTAENLFNNLVETIAESAGKHNAVSFFEEEKADSVTSKFIRLFGCQKPVHYLLGGGKSADVLLWRNKNISAGVLAGATAVWVLFEWLNYHLLSFIFFALVLGLLAQFVLKNASGLLNRSPSKVPRLVLPDDLFVNIAVAIGSELSRALGYLQDIACGGNLKQLLVNDDGGKCFVLDFFKKTFSQMNTFPDMGFGKSSGYAELQTRIFLAQLSGFVIKSVASFLPETHHCTVDAVAFVHLDFGTQVLRSTFGTDNKNHPMGFCFVAAHTLPVLYEEYEDQIDSFVYKVLDHLQHNYKKLDAGVLSRIPKGKKVE
ncbi:hypothetical protein FNV43_RR14721 [Rhamnella rubrinervis]|uniref:Reticulon-like protein n=1 Tax=Rhamnella rubrinervis TaxID=2594499 RepID=A0A8K0MGP7_9ROSA|nr:hypothetical protein FNV43_RR14721 [Rhamnella rubrinervis]